MSGFLGGILDAIGINTTPRGMLDAPVGTSTMQRVTNASPDFSPMISPGLLSNEQRLGAFWNLATRRAKPYTNRDLPQLSEAANEAYDAAGGFVGMSTPIRAYHGSPHTFDRFDLSKIGTGEGAQAYGHGLYFAGNERTSKTYRDLVQGMTAVDGRVLDPTAPAELRRVANLIASGDDWSALYRRAQLDADAMTRRASELTAAQKANPKNALVLEEIPMVEAARLRAVAELDALNQLKGRKVERPTGSMYEVNLRTSPERLLDWDKPLSQQPAAVREALGKVPWADAYVNSERLTGGQIAPKVPEGAAQLREAGIDGIQYLDAGSRVAGDGSRNYVMFRDDIIDILKRYGLLGMIGGGAAAVGVPEQ